MADRGFSLMLLGTPIVRRHEPDGREVELVWRLRRALQVVAFLATAPDRRSDRDELVEAVWPEASAETVRRNFHPTLSDARRTLGGAETLIFNQGVYALSSELDWRLDVELFEGHVARGRERRRDAPEEALDAWTAAWRLYRGPFLTGVETPWATRRREELRERYLALLGELGALAAELGRWTEAMDAYRSVLLEEPYEERIHRALMELYGGRGRRDLVRRQYVRLQEHLKELGVEPLEETQQCYHRLMR